MNYGGAYHNTPSRLAFQARAEDLDLVENLIVNKEGRIPDIAYPVGRDPASTAATIIVHDQEFHTSVWGHLGLLGLRDHVLLPGYAGYAGTAAASLAPTNAEVADLGRAEGAVIGYVHPFDSDPDPADTTKPLTAEFPVDVALGKVDYYEALGFVDDPMATAHVWYRMLNCGFRLPAGAGTDAMANFASLRGPVGMNRVYVHTGGAAQPAAPARFAPGRPQLRDQRAAAGVERERGCAGRRGAPFRRWRRARGTGAAPLQRARGPPRARGERGGAGGPARGGPALGGHDRPRTGAGGAAGSSSARAPTGRSIRCSISIPTPRRVRCTSP